MIKGGGAAVQQGREGRVSLVPPPPPPFGVDSRHFGARQKRRFIGTGHRKVSEGGGGSN